ncbi:hypothetical protein H175_85p014 (plasmid) [Bacillus thuringiensis serovar thuringiensis str. IS5056]|nr:hypothetical protein H175_85p014 [Bacillus thuringiensis serovar thuringiensis str. IS5056]
MGIPKGEPLINIVMVKKIVPTANEIIEAKKGKLRIFLIEH